MPAITSPVLTPIPISITGFPVMASSRFSAEELVLHGERRERGAPRAERVLLHDAPVGEDRVAAEALDGPAPAEDDPLHGLEVSVERRDERLRLGRAREAREAADIGEQDRPVAHVAVAGERDLAREDALDEVG